VVTLALLISSLAFKHFHKTAQQDWSLQDLTDPTVGVWSLGHRVPHTPEDADARIKVLEKQRSAVTDQLSSTERQLARLEDSKPHKGRPPKGQPGYPSTGSGDIKQHIDERVALTSQVQDMKDKSNALQGQILVLKEYNEELLWQQNGGFVGVLWTDLGFCGQGFCGVLWTGVLWTDGGFVDRRT
jgi:hypothetical protein